jgi:RNA polymerase sigma factor (sigma-70 family)
MARCRSYSSCVIFQRQRSSKASHSEVERTWRGRWGNPTRFRRGLRAADGDAFGELFDRHAQAIYGYCVRRTGDSSVAEDLLSIVFLEAWRRRVDARVDDGKMLPWLYGIAANVLRNQRRSIRRYRAALARLPVEAAEPDFSDDAAARASATAEAQGFLRDLDRLTSRERDVWSLVEWEGLSVAEVAAALRLSEAVVRTRLTRARARLRQTRLAPISEHAMRRETQ